MGTERAIEMCSCPHIKGLIPTEWNEMVSAEGPLLKSAVITNQ